jgi:hypothetical protein
MEQFMANAPWLGIVIGILLCMIGAICGWISGLSGFIEVANLRELRSSLRIKNFQYLIGGLAVAFVGDYRKVGLGDNFPSLIPAGCFAFGAMVLFYITVKGTQASIAKSVNKWNMAHKHEQLDVEAMLREYRHSGKVAFDSKFAEETARIIADGQEIATASRRARHAEASRAISRCTYAAPTSHSNRNSRPSNRGDS